MNNCIYLLENTRFSNSSNPDSFWTESTTSTSGQAWLVDGVPGIYENVPFYDCAVRPAIEVLKSNISY